MFSMVHSCKETKIYVIGPRGCPGPRGADGKTGEPGVPGQDGTNGQPGPPGETGCPGENGQPGAAGQQGEQGVPGDPGCDGRDGRPGRPGTIGLGEMFSLNNGVLSLNEASALETGYLNSDLYDTIVFAGLMDQPVLQTSDVVFNNLTLSGGWPRLTFFSSPTPIVSAPTTLPIASYTQVGSFATVLSPNILLQPGTYAFDFTGNLSVAPSTTSYSMAVLTGGTALGEAQTNSNGVAKLYSLFRVTAPFAIRVDALSLTGGTMTTPYPCFIVKLA